MAKRSKLFRGLIIVVILGISSCSAGALMLAGYNGVGGIAKARN